MNPPGATEIRIDDHRTTLSHGAAPEVVVTAGARSLAERLFRHDQPTPDEIERGLRRAGARPVPSGNRVPIVKPLARA